jgi:hypothetical protein
LVLTPSVSFTLPTVLVFLAADICGSRGTLRTTPARQKSVRLDIWFHFLFAFCSPSLAFCSLFARFCLLCPALARSVCKIPAYYFTKSPFLLLRRVVRGSLGRLLTSPAQRLANLYSRSKGETSLPKLGLVSYFTLSHLFPTPFLFKFNMRLLFCLNHLRVVRVNDESSANATSVSP